MSENILKNEDDYTNVRLKKSVQKRLKIKAAQEDKLSMSEVVETLLDNDSEK